MGCATLRVTSVEKACPAGRDATAAIGARTPGSGVRSALPGEGADCRQNNHGQTQHRGQAPHAAYETSSHSLFNAGQMFVGLALSSSETREWRPAMLKGFCRKPVFSVVETFEMAES